MEAAVLGLGLIGSEWAGHLDSDRVLAATWNRSAKPEAPHFVETPKEALENAQIIHLVVGDENSARSVLSQCQPHLSKTHIVIQSTTIDAETSNFLKNMTEEAGARYLEAPFTGSLLAAKDRQTVFYLGGDIELIEECTPYLARISGRRFVIGTNEQACRLKLNMNLLISAQIIALTEALSSCRLAGISDEKFFSALAVNAASSGVSKLKEPKLVNSDFSPQFSIKHMAKDMRLLGATTSTGALHGTCLEVLNRAALMGYGDEDISAVLKVLADN